ncbi:zinc knuckle-domain-containing protein [Peziza echinospora]|nr:zinc knuckle-domain-containing protein [Peziza echinospora]
MNRHRGGWSSSASSKASPSTVCQKCLKKGHYSYECKVSQVERPYTSRPSRTQQLFDPAVRQKLTMAVPPEEERKNDPTRKQGVADEILAKKERERSSTNKRRRDSRSVSPARRRRRSPSASSVSSFSSVSSARSPSPPRRPVSRKSRSPSPDRRVRRRYRDSPSPVRGRGIKDEEPAQKARARSRSSAHSRRSPLPENHKQPPPRRERSLSPFSRRIALTKSMGKDSAS